jgi:XTP/dITP diphosphohydrolase
MSERVVLATGNKGKVREFSELLADRNILVVPQTDFAVPDAEETGLTFVENAILKARNAAAHTGLPAIADDSGLAVDILGGAPGIFSARWCGRHGDDRANLDLLLAQLADVRAEHRAAGFVCAAALVLPDGTEVVEHGHLRGLLLTAPRGDGGFGYDPILLPDDRPVGDDRSCAELSPAEKNAISHRGKAFRALAPRVVEALAGRG